MVADDLQGHLLLQFLGAVAEVAGVAVEPVVNQDQQLVLLSDVTPTSAKKAAVICYLKLRGLDFQPKRPSAVFC
jgi:hypothetical protein